MHTLAPRHLPALALLAGLLAPSAPAQVFGQSPGPGTSASVQDPGPAAAGGLVAGEQALTRQEIAALLLQARNARRELRREVERVGGYGDISTTRDNEVLLTHGHLFAGYLSRLLPEPASASEMAAFADFEGGHSHTAGSMNEAEETRTLGTASRYLASFREHHAEVKSLLAERRDGPRPGVDPERHRQFMEFSLKEARKARAWDGIKLAACLDGYDWDVFRGERAGGFGRRLRSVFIPSFGD